ncbi:MAG TPA: DUF2975 domain-containing protein [Allosphingosinicella sp.]|jgi:hypothetical protein
MSAAASPALALSRALLKALVVLNLAVAASDLAAIALSLVYEAEVVRYFRDRPIEGDVAAFVDGFRWMMIVGLLVFPLVHVIATRLLAIVETVRGGDPFVAANAERMKLIAWALLGTQVLHLVFGLFAAQLSRPNAEIDWAFSSSGWIAVLLLFVLARVFEHGAAMRADLEGTV